MPYDEKREFLILNTDLVDRKMAKNMYRYLLNGVTGASEQSNLGAVENVLGNVLVDEPVGASGDNVCIGSALNPETNTIVFFNWNSGGNHGIYEFNPDAQVGSQITAIYESSILAFQKDKKITGVDIINGQLIFVENVTEIKKINIATGKAGLYSVTAIENITLMKRPPILPMKVTTLVDEDYVRNYIDSDSFQFTYRYVYNDNEKSVFAPLSHTVAIDKNVEAVSNAISVQIVDNEVVPETVKKIEWVFRTNSTNEYAIFKVGGRLQKLQVFHNDVAGITVSDAEINKPFDDIPLTARGLRVAENRVLLNDYLHGYDHPEVSLTAVAVANDTQAIEENVTLYERPQTITQYYRQHENASQCSIRVIPGTYDRYWYQLSLGRWVKVDYNESTRFAYVRPGQGDGFTGLSLRITDTYESDDQWCKDRGFFDTLQVDPPIPTAVVATVFLTNVASQQAFKFRDTYQLALRFSGFGNRNVGASTNPSARVTIPDPDDPANPTTLYTEIQWNLTGDTNQIPTWAISYEIVRTRNLSRSFFLQGRAADLVYGQRRTESNEENLELSKSPGEGKFLYLYIENSTRYKIGYVHSEGDRCTIYRENVWYDLEIKSQDGPYLVLDYEDLGSLGSATDPDATLYEIYTPAQGQIDDVFYEIGEKFTIIDPGTAERSYEVTEGFIRGDIYRKQRKIFRIGDGIANYNLTPPNRVFIFADDPILETFEAMNPNDQYYERWVSDIGRATQELKDARQLRKRYTLKFGGEFTPDTFLNNTSSFNAQDEYKMPYENGPAVALENSNNVLLYFHERETSSVYIGEGFLRTQDGQSSLLRVVDIVGDDRKLRTGHGCINPESIVPYEDDVFFWDLYKGAVVRYTVEGLVTISKYGMKNFFYVLSRILLPHKDESFVYGAYDPFLDYYILTFAPVPNAGYLGVTVAFNAEENMWNGFWSFRPENYFNINQRLYSILDGKPWKHGENVLCNNFYGVQYTRILRYVCNDQGSKLKIWANFRIDAESVTADLDADVIVVKITNSNGQEGRIYAHHLEKRESVFITENGIKQDVNTPNDENIAFTEGLPEQQGYFMYHGDVIRSQVCEVEITNNRTDLSPMFFATMLYRLSEASFA